MDRHTSNRDFRELAALYADRVEGRPVARTIRITASGLLPPSWDGMSLPDRARALDAIRARALAGTIADGADSEEATDND
jgi:hypothetical protein